MSVVPGGVDAGPQNLHRLSPGTTPMLWRTLRPNGVYALDSVRGELADTVE